MAHNIEFLKKVASEMNKAMSLNPPIDPMGTEAALLEAIKKNATGDGNPEDAIRATDAFSPETWTFFTEIGVWTNPAPVAEAEQPAAPKAAKPKAEKKAKAPKVAKVAKPKAAKKAKAVKAPKAAKAPKGEGIGEYARKRIKEDKELTNKVLAEEIVKKFKSATTPACVAYYRHQLVAKKHKKAA